MTRVLVVFVFVPIELMVHVLGASLTGCLMKIVLVYC